MQLNQITEKLNNIHSGSFHKITFKSEPPMKAAYKNSGFKIVKVTEMIMRTGISYAAIKTVSDESSIKRANNYESVIKNKLLFNTKTQKHYARIYPYSNVKSCYYAVSGPKMVPVEDISEYVISSYLNRKVDDVVVLNIGIDNILSL